jgi:hypothetical protein
MKHFKLIADTHGGRERYVCVLAETLKGALRMAEAQYGLYDKWKLIEEEDVDKPKMLFSCVV